MHKKLFNQMKSNRDLILQVLIGLFLPLLLCVTYTALQGYSLFQVSLLTCDWNDELFYFKQVESILQYGYPLGYMGFNESHAISYSFAAWSPVLVWPWVLWGAVFGWHLSSPIFCNIVIYGLTLAAFTLLVRPGWKQFGRMMVLFALYTLNLRYLLSCMPEIICFCHLILFYAVAISYEKGRSKGKLVMLFLMGALMTWMRPYLILTQLLPAFYWIRESLQMRGQAQVQTEGQADRKTGSRRIPAVFWFSLAGSGLCMLGTLIVYVLINHYLAAAYFTDLFYTKWLTTFFTDGFGAGVKNFLYTLYDKGTTFLRHTVQGCIDGLWSGTFFAAYLAVMALLLLCVWGKIVRCRHGRAAAAAEHTESTAQLFRPQLHLFFSMLAMLFALLLMYKINEGSKHLLTFIAAGLFLLALDEKKPLLKTGALSLLFVWLFCFHVIGSFDFHVTYADRLSEERSSYWQETFSEQLSLNPDQQPSYENTVIWNFSDLVQDREVVTDWQMLYLLPPGSGISCCYRDFVYDNLDTLQSRYLATVSGGEIAKKCEAAGYRVLGDDGRLVVFCRY